ncbi:MAG TPA: molybdopterin-synthase adenylyltransferase MoeB [Candidatus Angelobacter sp.]|jgi:molybdopterin/thiamine biosynthesis adenylyltransferase/rhodanese-related sulfurtransferase|nr:molybdopterin-synthase adenylyltransferase MoeB [Candidatus Angelobacter sp.]
MAQSSRDLLAAARAVVPEVTAEDVHRRGRSNGHVLLDVREQDEVDQGYITGAVHLSKGFLELQIEDRVPDRATPITIYCAGGVRSLLAGQALRSMGYENVESLAGGFSAWKQKGYEFTVPKLLTPEQKIRYSRHLLVPEVGEEGQQKLLAARVLLIGAGGLGAPAALYLAAAGVGTLGLLDFDTVDMSNLQRQVIHTQDRVGMAKTESARIQINALNPDVKVVEHREMLNSENAREIFEQYDIIVNGCDNFPTRYLANDVAIFTKKPLVDGGIFRFEGQVTTVLPHQSPCYRCRYPAPPPPEEAPSCAEAGVIGVLPGIVGVLQATEVVKLIVGAGEPLAGRLLHIDALDMKFREFRVPRDPQCPVCGESPTITEPIDYEGFCMMPNAVPAELGVLAAH